MTADIRFDAAGLRAALNTAEMRHLVEEAANRIAGHVREQGIEVGAFAGGGDDIPLPVKVVTDRTDRAHAEVVLAHPAGLAVQAKHGALTKAASAEGLTVRGD